MEMLNIVITKSLSLPLKLSKLFFQHRVYLDPSTHARMVLLYLRHPSETDIFP